MESMKRVMYLLMTLNGYLQGIQKVTREREIWSRLEHPNIVPLCGYTEESDLFGPFGALVSPVSCLLAQTDHWC